MAWVVVELEEKERHRQAGMCLGGRVIGIIFLLVWRELLTLLQLE